MNTPERTPVRIYVFLAIGLAAASQSGNLVRLGDAPPLAMAAWRLTLASLLLAPLCGRDGLAALRHLGRRERWLVVAAGAMLAGHLGTWIAAVQLTTVANAAIFFAVNPVITAIAGYLLFREPITPRLMLSIALGLGGVLVIGGGDFALGSDALLGDALAVVCSALFTAYFLIGKRIRPHVPNGAYVTAVYGSAGLVAFLGVAVLGLPVVDYTERTWLAFVLLAIVPTMIGHTAMNASLRFLPASRLSVATLVEPPLAGLVAALAWGEPVTSRAAGGYALIAASVVVLVTERAVRTERASIPRTAPEPCPPRAR